LDADARKRHEIPNEVQGALVLQVLDGSSAAENGLGEGMVITHYKRRQDASFKAVKQPKQLLDAAKAMKSGDQIALKVFYKGKTDLRGLRAGE
jgi:S1-C subfamily serine protease